MPSDTLQFGIWTPAPESAPHAGVKVLWRLGRELEARGQAVRMWMGGVQPDCDILILPERSAPPEVHHPKLIRWALFFGGHTYGRTYTWSPMFADAPPLTVPYYDTEELFDPGLPRWGTATWSGKGDGPAGDRPIDRMMPRSEVIHILQTSELLISYDAHSALNTEATLCGTPVHIPLPRPQGMPLTDDPGIRWADVDNTHRIGEALAMVQQMDNAATPTIDAFLADMQEWR